MPVACYQERQLGTSLPTESPDQQIICHSGDSLNLDLDRAREEDSPNTNGFQEDASVRGPVVGLAQALQGMRLEIVLLGRFVYYRFLPKA